VLNIRQTDFGQENLKTKSL